MDEPVAPGQLLRVGTDTYVAVQHPALSKLPTVICLPATREPTGHQPPLLYHDPTTGLWLHTYSPVTVPRQSAYPLGPSVSAEMVETVTAGLVHCLSTDPVAAVKAAARYETVRRRR